MALSETRVLEQARILKKYHEAERAAMDEIRRIWKGRQDLPATVPSSAPKEIKRMAESSRVNVCAIVVETFAQSMFVDGIRADTDSENHPVWQAWQANRMDKHQAGIFRAAIAYGASYAIVLPGDTYPVIRGVSPRNLTALYGEDPDWPLSALERLGNGLWRVFDEEAAYYVGEKKGSGDFEFIETRKHGQGVTPVVRFLDEQDLDADDDVTVEAAPGREAPLPLRGQVAPLAPIQDQVNMTTFRLAVAEHYGAFKQKYILGYADEEELKRLNASAAEIWGLDVDAEGEGAVKVGEFAQTETKDMIAGREASLRHAASLSQAPVHELTGQLIQLSAEALAASEAGKDRKVGERQAGMGESVEQVAMLAGRLMGEDVPDDAQVRWRDTSARAFAATVDALGKMAQMLQIPPQELWERIPDTTPKDIERWKAAAEEGDSFSALTDMLNRQANGNGNTPPVPTPN